MFGNWFGVVENPWRIFIAGEGRLLIIIKPRILKLFNLWLLSFHPHLLHFFYPPWPTNTWIFTFLVSTYAYWKLTLAPIFLFLLQLATRLLSLNWTFIPIRNILRALTRLFFDHIRLCSQNRRVQFTLFFTESTAGRIWGLFGLSVKILNTRCLGWGSKFPLAAVLKIRGWCVWFNSIKANLGPLCCIAIILILNFPLLIHDRMPIMISTPSTNLYFG